ncbi:zinc ribbon domain-containing protein [Streptosporangium sp. NPDC002544]|uniref:zinc ribbon domain-containing protein n=1 Tax=Streptosporangium sp. NPDC002544 TaxID=3154538 RepID=UPI0033319B72
MARRRWRPGSAANSTRFSPPGAPPGKHGSGRHPRAGPYGPACRGGQVVKVPAAGTSQTCHRCGHREATNRDGTKFACRNPDCGWVGHADTNAAINIKNVDGPSLAPVVGERGPPRGGDVPDRCGRPGRGTRRRQPGRQVPGRGIRSGPGRGSGGRPGQPGQDHRHVTEDPPPPGREQDEDPADDLRGPGEEQRSRDRGRGPAAELEKVTLWYTPR